jgi:hypothetical protein
MRIEVPDELCSVRAWLKEKEEFVGAPELLEVEGYEVFGSPVLGIVE